MNILFLSTENPYPLDGGHHLRTFNVLKILSKRNKIHFIGFAQNKKEKEDTNIIKQLCETVDIYLIPKTGYNFRFLLLTLKNVLSKSPLVAQKYLLKEAKNRIKLLIQEYDIDLIHIDMLPLSLYKNDFRNLPAILTNHNIESLRLYRWMKLEKKLQIKAFLYYQYLKLKKFEQQMCPLFNRCIVVSDYDKKYLKQHCQTNNFVVIPNGVDIKYFKPSNGKVRNNHLVWVGAMVGPYNSDAVDYFLDEIWILIKKQIPEVTIDFIGEAPTKKLRQNASEDLNIKTFGFVDDIRPIVQRASLFIAPIRSGSGTKIKVLNAMALAKPVVATTIAAEGIDVIPEENISIADNPSEFAKKVISLLTNQIMAKTIGQKARELIENKYSWEIIAKDINLLYENYCNSANKLR